MVMAIAHNVAVEKPFLQCCSCHLHPAIFGHRDFVEMRCTMPRYKRIDTGMKFPSLLNSELKRLCESSQYLWVRFFHPSHFDRVAVFYYRRKVAVLYSPEAPISPLFAPVICEGKLSAL